MSPRAVTVERIVALTTAIECLDGNAAAIDVRVRAASAITLRYLKAGYLETLDTMEKPYVLE